jgi:small conductance mechanosensitive channel
MEDVIQKGYDIIIAYGPKILGALLIFIFGRWITKIVTTVIEKTMRKAKVEDTLVGFISHLTTALLLTFVVVAALNQLGIQTTSLVAILGAAGLAVGLALQGSLSNFAAGVMIIIFKPFRVGDFIEAAGTLGTVHEIQIFNTLLDHPDNRRIVVPNSQITGGIISNFSSIEKRRIDLVFGISYSDDMKKAKDTLLEVLKAETRILKDPAPVVAVSELGESSVNLVCRPWVKPADYWDVRFAIVEKGKNALEKNGITIPFPQRDIHMYTEK